MSEGLEALNDIRQRFSDDSTSNKTWGFHIAKELNIIGNELEALEIIIKKSVDVHLLKGCKYVDTYNDNIGYDEEPLTDEEFGLICEVMGI